MTICPWLNNWDSEVLWKPASKAQICTSKIPFSLALMCWLIRSRTAQTDTFLCWGTSVQPGVLLIFHSRTSLAIGVTFGVLCWNKSKTLFLIWQAGTWAVLHVLFNSTSSFQRSRTLVLFRCKKGNPLNADLISWREEKEGRWEAYSPTFRGIVQVKAVGKIFQVRQFSLSLHRDLAFPFTTCFSLNP